MRCKKCNAYLRTGNRSNMCLPCENDDKHQTGTESEKYPGELVPRGVPVYKTPPRHILDQGGME